MSDAVIHRPDAKKRRGRPPRPSAAPAPASPAPGSTPSEQDGDIVFALDIGTRTVIGIVGRRTSDGGFQVLACEMMEHPGRAMMDGQVEDIAQVGRLIVQVKQRLEARLQTRLARVAIAAAGRMLRTVRVRAQREFSARTLADRDTVIGLEGEALEQAQEQIRGGGAAASYYCVGYSIVEYRMDDQPVSQLMGHSCSAISVELLAAFLPYSVVEGLYAAVDISGLEVTSLTLEPIAAINVLIPRELRLLNLALVDIGAGTSDIAVCREGQIASYEMATIAGDELTEAIIRAYLVDFSTAEQLKRRLAAGEETLSFENILGMPCAVSAEDLLSSLQPTIDQLAETIAEKLTACNGGAPAAVFLIGGGSQIPGLGAALSRCLALPQEKIAVGPRRSLKGVELSDFPELTGPEFITPIGIAVTAITQECFHFFGVSINGRRLKLLNTSHMRLMDVLLMAGFRSGQIIARSGRSLLFTLNGAQHAIRGGIAEPASLTLNGAPASIEADVRPGDVIEITPARDGAPARATLRDLIPPEGCLSLRINGRPATPDTPIAAGDAVEIVPLPAPAGLEPAQPAAPDAGPQPAETTAAGSADPAAQAQQSADDPAPDAAFAGPSGETALAEKPQPDAGAATEPCAAADSAAQQAAEPAACPDAGETDAQEACAAAETQAPAEDFTPGASLQITLNGEPLTLPLSSQQPAYHLMHLLERAGVDPSHPQGKIRMECDGAPVGFMHPIENGANVRIVWE